MSSAPAKAGGSFDDLEAMLREAHAIELRHRRGTGSVRRLKEIAHAQHETWANEANWRPGRLLELWYKAPDDALPSVFIGFFQERLHIRYPARRLVPCLALAEANRQPHSCEFVSGKEWLGGPVRHRVDPPTAGEVAHIRAAWQPRTWRPSWKRARSADEIAQGALAPRNLGRAKGDVRASGAASRTAEQLLSDWTQVQST